MFTNLVITSYLLQTRIELERETESYVINGKSVCVGV
jgi:hypothetical protein